MVFIIGGYAQGKMEYAKENFQGRQIFELNDWAWKKFCENADVLAEVKAMIEADPEMVIVSQEIGKGIVPLDKEQRDCRDSIGRLQVEIAKLAESVIRVSCGIGQKIK